MRPDRRGYTLVELLTAVAIVATLVGLLLPAVEKAREAAARASCQNNVKQYVLGGHSYEAAVGRFPPSAAFPNKPPAAYTACCAFPEFGYWANAVGPWMEAPPSDPVWYGTPRLMPCPSKRQTGWGYAAGDWPPAGPDRGFVAYGNVGHKATAFPDGLSQTLAVAEACWSVFGPTGTSSPAWGSGVWYAATMRTTQVPPQHDATGDLRGFGGPHATLTAGFADGSVRGVAFTVDPAVWNAAGTRAGGETTAAP